MGYIQKHRYGIFGTIVFFTVVVVILISFGFYTQLPLPGEEGILVNFGVDDNGAGLIEPQKSNAKTQEVKVEEIIPQETEPQTNEEAKVKGEDVLNQDYEEAAAIKKKKIEVEKKKRIKEKEIQRQKQLIEEQRQKEEALKKKKEQEEKQNVINDRIKNAFSTGKNDSANSSKSEGVTSGKGNQGSVNGSVDSKNHGKGNGRGNKGIFFSLKGRNPKFLPKPEYNLQLSGIVVVEVTVDQYGNVVKTNPGIKGSTTLDATLLNAAQKAALKAKFDVKHNAPAYQKGTITYHFILQ
ncbi:MAG: hypothetical protein IMY72_11115 [Bacteroidetes bacterium]|nr:hypothetical protein [Bacteroidota bacterium]